MAITAEFLAQLIEKAEDIQAVFDENISPLEGEAPEKFQSRKQDLINETLALVGKNPLDAKVSETPKASDIPIIVDCLGTPLTEGYVDSEGKTYDVSNIDKIPENLKWKKDGEFVVNRNLNDDLDAINEQFLKVAIAKQWIMQNKAIPFEQKSDYVLQQISVNDDDYPRDVLRCLILFNIFNPTQNTNAFIYEDGHSVSYAKQDKSPFTNNPLEKKIGTPNQLLDKLAAEYADAVIEYKQMIQQHPELQEFVEAKMKEYKEAQAAEIESIKEKQAQERIQEAQAQERILERQKAISKYTDYMGIRAQLALELSAGINAQSESFQKINCACLFVMDRIRTEYPGIEKEVNSEAIEVARLAFKKNLDRIPPEVLGNYDRACNEHFKLSDKIHNGTLSCKESDKALEQQARLMDTQKDLEQRFPEIQYKLLLAQARNELVRNAQPLKRISLRKRTGKEEHPPFLFNSSPQNWVQFFPRRKPEKPEQIGDYLKFYILLVGEPNVGISALMHRFADNTFAPDMRAPHFDRICHSVYLDESKISLDIDRALTWERPILRNERHVLELSKDNHACFFVFAVNNRDSFDAVKKFLEEHDQPELAQVLVATKCDIEEKEWAISKEEISGLAEKFTMDVYFTSAKENLCVQHLFMETVKSACQQEKKPLLSIGGS